MAWRASILIPTFLRPTRAVEAARSALAQQTDAAFEIVLIDNDPAGSALAALRAIDDPRVVILHEPRPGLAHARNAGLRAASGEFIAFLDDDEIAPETWLGELLRVQAETGADVVFGPVRTKLADAPREHAAYFEDFFARNPNHAEGEIDEFYGCGSSLIRRASLPSAEPFSTTRNESGGEDDLLFQSMKAARARFAWAPKAWVFEIPEPSRVKLDYTLKRAFAFGQGPATQAWMEQPRNWRRIVFWMAVGFGQSLVFGTLALSALIFRRPLRAFAYRRFIEGAGKLLWFPPLKPRLYGAARLPRSKRLSRA